MEGFEHKAELSDKELEKILFLSFMFSQGSIGLQNAILISLSEITGKQDETRVREAFERMVQNMTPKDKSEATIVTAKIHGKFDTPLDGSQEIEHVLALSKKHGGASDSIETIADEIWERDWKFIVARDGRSNRRADFKANTLQDPYFSFGVHYVERETSSGNQHFDTLLEKVRDIPRSDIFKRVKVIEKYNETHPESPLEIV